MNFLAPLLLCTGLSLAEPVLEPDKPDRSAPDRAFDILRLHLDLDLEIKTRSIGGTATYGLKRMSDADFSLDQVALDIGNVTVDGASATWRTPGNMLVIEVPDSVAIGAETEVAIEYQATPRSGLHFRSAGGGSPDLYDEVWTQGQKRDNRYWFPTWDHPNDRFDYTGEVRAPKGWHVTTNSGVNTPAYLIMVAAGRYKVVGEPENQVWVPPKTSAAAIARVLDPVPDMMDHFAKRSGVVYPWGHYKQVFVQRFMYGGMENISATINSADVLVDEPVDETRDRIVSLVAHELAHQWYGDYLTCRTWRDLWLNEGFATFMAADWMSKRDGPVRKAYEADSWRRSSRWEASLAGRFFHGPDASMNNNVYSKGAMVLHMLRVMLGEDQFWAGIRDYTTGHPKSLVRTSDLQESMERVSGRELDWFFQQWVELPYVPELTVKSRYADGELVLTVRQSTNDKRPRYTIPFEVEVGTKQGPINRRYLMVEETLERSISMEEAPTYVAFDPQGGVLAALTDEQDPAAWAAQLDSPSFYAVFQAIRALGETDESEALLAVLSDEERHPLIRSKAASALGRQRATSLLLPHVRATHGRVRKAVVGALGKGTSGEALPTLEARLRSDKNPDVRASALASITELSDTRGLALARRSLQDRHRKVVEEAIDVIGDHGSANDVASLLTLSLRRRVRDDGYRAAARILGRIEDGPARERGVSTLTSHLIRALDDVDLRSRQTAVRLLKNVGDKTAVPHLETLRREETVAHIADSAGNAARKIRMRSEDDADRPGDKNQTQVRIEELEKRLDELESEVEAWRDKH